MANATLIKAALLNSWKEIASYAGRGVRTMQRWEHDLGLPVHRPKGRDRSAVLAFTNEIDDWLHHTPVRSLRDGARLKTPPQMFPLRQPRGNASAERYKPVRSCGAK